MVHREVQQASKVECSRDSIMVKTVSLTTGVSMGWHDIEAPGSRTLLQQLEKWHSILSTHAWQACKFEADMRAMARDNDLSLSVYQRHLHDYVRYVYVVDGNYWHKMAFLVVDVSEVEVLSFLMPHKGFQWYRSNISCGNSGRRGCGSDVWSANFIQDHQDIDRYIELESSDEECWWPGGIGACSASTEEAVFLHLNIIKVCKRLFANLACDPDPPCKTKNYSSEEDWY